MTEEETRAELIDPVLKDAGWGVVIGSKVNREYNITKGEILAGGERGKAMIADYVLSYNNRKVAVIEAKADTKPSTEGVTQAKEYAKKLEVEYTFATNGKEWYQIYLPSGKEGKIDTFPTPDDLWSKIESKESEWKKKFDQIPFEDVGGTKIARYYQEIAVNKVVDAVAEDKKRILLTLATGTGKTFIAFQIAWKLFHSRWNLQKDGKRLPRVLFLADRNILANQAFNAFSAFDEDALARINPLDIRKKGSVPTNASIFFTIFQTFMSGKDGSYYFGEYPPDFFDFIIIDECHRGGANDEGNWRKIMEYFKPAVQLGLTATPRRKVNADTYKYFGKPVYTYSLKDGVKDGFLTPYRVKRIQSTHDEYVYSPDDDVVEGEVEEGKVYTADDYNKVIRIEEVEKKRVETILNSINQNDKTIIFCANQTHALAIRDLINQMKKSADPDYCVRVTANDGLRGEQYLREFQDNEKTVPTILTTSQKLSTGVDALNIRNIVLMRPINSMVEFKQIIGRGTRTYEGKKYFTIYDFVNAYRLFLDPEWDGEPIEETDIKQGKKEVRQENVVGPDSGNEVQIVDTEPKLAIVKLAPGKEVQVLVSTTFWGPDGKPISAQQFIKNFYGVLPEIIDNEKELTRVWANPTTRKALLSKLANLGYGADELDNIQRLVKAEDSDIFDVLASLAFSIKPLTRTQRAKKAKSELYNELSQQEKEFVDFVMEKFENDGSYSLDDSELSTLINLKYKSIADAEEKLGDVDKIRSVFLKMQEKLFSRK